MVEITALKQNKGKRMKRIEDSLRDLWDIIRCTNIQVIRVPEEEEKKKGTEKIFEDIIVENFLNMGKEIIKPRSTESPLQDKPKEKHIKTIWSKLTEIKHKERILNLARKKQQVSHKESDTTERLNWTELNWTYKGNPIQLTVDLSAEILQIRREWQDIFKVLKEKNLQPRLLYLAKISFKIDRELKSFIDKQKSWEFSTSNAALQQILKG